MRTQLHPLFQGSPEGAEAETILRNCVHCGFCNATCPTYQELGDERDGPRGRIYLIKQLLENGEATAKTQHHLDRCLTCRSCETTCPSGVQYGRLLDIARGTIEQNVSRPLWGRLVRWTLRRVLPYRVTFTPLLRIGQIARPLLPDSIACKIPKRQSSTPRPENRHDRVMIALAGCIQAAATPNTNAAAARVLDRLDITVVEEPGAGCCGAVSYHLSEHEEGLDFMRSNIDAWWPAVEAGAEAIVTTASGCGAMVKDYGHLLASDNEYAEKARTISSMTKDLSEVISAESLTKLQVKDLRSKIAVHCPCTLQHGQQLPDILNNILSGMGFKLAKTQDQHLCCGSAGTYSLLQPKLSQKFLRNKLQALSIDTPDRIVTANVGCQLHLGSKATVPVQHWIEVIDESLQ